METYGTFLSHIRYLNGKYLSNFDFLQYIFQINNYYKCDATSNEEITKTTTNSSITLSNLNPGTRYSISVKARNAKFAGQEETAERYIPESCKLNIRFTLYLRVNFSHNP